MPAEHPDPLVGLAEFVADEPFDEDTWRARARILLADALVQARASSGVRASQAMLDLGAGSGPQRSWATGARLGAADAVQANATAICTRFQEDTEMSSWAHPGSFVVPAGAAAALTADTTMGTLLDGLVAGYATTSWLGGDGAVPSLMMSRSLRPSPSFAPAGACAAACRALGLSATQTRHALGAAVLVGRGTLHSVGAGGDDWRLHNAGGARDGFLCALAAGAGMVSGDRALTSPVGFLAAYTGSPEQPPAWAKPPHGARILDVWQKALPTLGDNMAVALAAARLHDLLDGSAPQQVTVTMNAQFAEFPGTQTRPPFHTRTAAQASVRFVTALLLLTGDLDLADYDGRRSDQYVTDLADRIEVVADPELDFTDAVVTVRTAEGAHTCRTSDDLSRSLFFFDADQQRAVASRLVGAAGPQLVDAVLDADDSRTAAAVVEEALDSC